MTLLHKILTLLGFDRSPPPQPPAPRRPAARVDETSAVDLANKRLEALKTDLDFLIKRLNYVSQDPKDQEEKRRQAMLGLQQLGKDAEKAIPNLAMKLFAERLQERQLAQQTLETIAPDWEQGARTKDILPFLVKQLRKGAPVDEKAARILIKVGPPAASAILDVLDLDSGDDHFFQANCLRVLSRIEPPDPALSAIVAKVLENSDAPLLLEGAADSVYHMGGPDEQTLPPLWKLLEHKNTGIRSKTLKAFSRATVLDDAMLPILLRCLSDENEEVRKEAVQTLRGYHSEQAMDFYIGVVKKRGDFTVEDLRIAFDRIWFVFSNSSVESFRRDHRHYVNNLSWHALEFQRELNRPVYLLGAVLSVLEASPSIPPDIADDLIFIFEMHPDDNIRAACLSLLAKCPERAELVVPFLYQNLNHPSERVRGKTVEAFNTLNPDWMNTPASQAYITGLINDMVASGKQLASKNALSSLGGPVVPILAAHLEQSERSVIQQAILEVLDTLGVSAEISLPVLLHLKETCTNTRTLAAIHTLIRKWEGPK
jgi:hypothetical protein